jgi:hypothetical protein
MACRPLSLVAATGAFLLAIAAPTSAVSQSAVASECKTLPEETPSVALRDALRYAAQPEEKVLSTLITPGLPGVTLLRTSVGTDRVVAITREDDSGPKPVATLAARGGSSGESATEVHWYGEQQDASADSLGTELVALETLYALVLREPPTSSFAIRGMMKDAQARQATQGQALAEVSRIRECIVSQLALLRPSRDVRRWHMAYLRRVSKPTDTASNERIVAVAITDEGGPLAGATVVFSRGPHLLCTAKSDAAGIARCKLYDSHSGDDDDVESSATVATFTGNVVDSVVHPPTTFLFGERP